jgi:hypothetical protein
VIKEATPVDIDHVPELVRLAEEVRATNVPRVLRRGEEDLAVLVPVSRPKPRRRRRPTEADYQAFLSSAGGWRDNVDVDQLKAGFAESRALPPRPRPDL